MQYNRNYDFATGTTIVADQIDQEFNSIKGVINGNIDTDNLVDVSVVEEKIATNAVTTDKIKDANVTIAKITNPSVCKITNSADIAVTGGGWRTLSLNTDIFDPSDMHSPTVNPERITIKEAGYYSFGGILRWATGTYGGIKIIRYNSSGASVTGGAMNFESTNRDIMQVSGFHYLNAGDYLTLNTFAAVNSTVTFNSEYEANMCLWCYLVCK